MAKSNIPRDDYDDQYDEKARAALGAKISALLVDRQWSQSDLARASGLKRDAISTYVRGRVWPNPQSFTAVARALGITPHELRPGQSEIQEAVVTSFNSPPPSRVSRLTARPRDGSSNATGITSKPADTIGLIQATPGVWRLTVDHEFSAEVAFSAFAILTSELK